MTGKVCVITGGTAGIGYETALALAAKGATVIIAARNPEKGARVVEQIKAATGNENLHFFFVDFDVQASIREAGRAIREQFPVIDVLINNHGAFVSKHTLTPDGIEAVFAVNHLAYFLFTHLLYPALRQAAEARIVNVASRSHVQVKGMFFEDLNLTHNYHGLRAYAQSKLANILFTYELHRRKKEPNVFVNAVHPGLVKTDIGMKRTNLLYALAWRIRTMLWPSLTPAQGAATSVYLAASDEARGKSGLYWADCKAVSSSKASCAEQSAARLWEISEKVCGIEDFFKP